MFDLRRWGKSPRIDLRRELGIFSPFGLTQILLLLLLLRGWRFSRSFQQLLKLSAASFNLFCLDYCSSLSFHLIGLSGPCIALFSMEYGTHVALPAPRSFLEGSLA